MSSQSFPCEILLSSAPFYGWRRRPFPRSLLTGKTSGYWSNASQGSRLCSFLQSPAPLISSSASRVICGILPPIDPWSPAVDSQSVASQLFAVSLLPYLGFLYYITRSKTAPKLTLFGFYFLLAFVGATIPAGIYAKLQYGTSLSNVDWLHGSAESLLALTNLFIVLGLRGALRKINNLKKDKV